jgi:hypothetical protein
VLRSINDRKNHLKKTPGAKVRILAIFGNSKGIDIGKDRAFLEQLSDKAQTEFLVEPQPEELNDHLWEKKAGTSSFLLVIVAAKKKGFFSSIKQTV